ncbi:MAG TPA: VWA domain-containing protein [Gaiellaceae bacterium]|nr:VWA domain-containing protein [Gaiellaceae bacterium]
MTFLTPDAAAFAALAAVPVAALVAGSRRVARVRETLRLPAPPSRGRWPRAACLVGVIALLALAAMQPALRERTSLRARTDAAAFVVLDTSRSMAAARTPGGTTRLARAKRVALDLAARTGDVPLGVATFTDRVLPDLFPTADRAAFDAVVGAVSIESPPPRDVNTVATTFDALGSLGTGGFFAADVRRRAVVLVTDGESRPFDPGAVAGTLAAHGIALDVVRVGGAEDRVFRPNGTPEANYRPDPAGAAASVAQLAAAVHRPADSDPAAFVERVAGRGRARVVGTTTRTRTLAPYAALLALLPLLGVLNVRASVPSPRWHTMRRTSGRAA